MKQPLVTRPAYGYGRPAMPIGESKLPKGEPGGKGAPLDPDIPGSATFAKPEDDIREFDKAPPGSIYRKDGPDDQAKPQDDPKGDRKELEWVTPTYNGPGGRPKDDPTVTKYPYRGDRPYRHYASELVVGMYLVEQAHEAPVSLEQPVRVAATIAEVTQGLSPKVEQKARSCRATLKRADVGNLRWIFSVNCGNGLKVVKLKASRGRSNVVKLSKMDVLFACSCPAWQWLGPEHNAQLGGYLDGKPRGTASPPDVKDPRRRNRVCKHVASVIHLVRDWTIPAK